MVATPQDDALWYELCEDARGTFNGYCDGCVPFFREWERSMKRDAAAHNHHAQGWADPPRFIHFPGFGAEPGNWTFVDGFLRRAVEGFTASGGAQIMADITEALRYRDEHIERFREIGEKWSAVSPEEAEAAESRANQPFTNAEMERWNRTPIRAWAAQLWGGACDDLDRWVHRWYANAAHIASLSAVTAFYPSYGVLPEPPAPSAPAHSDPALELEPPDENGYPNGGRCRKWTGGRWSRSDYEIVWAIFELHRDKKLKDLSSMYGLGVEIEKRKRKVAGDGWGHQTISDRADSALEKCLPGVDSKRVGLFGGLGALLETFASENDRDADEEACRRLEAGSLIETQSKGAIRQ